MAFAVTTIMVEHWASTFKVILKQWFCLISDGDKKNQVFTNSYKLSIFLLLKSYSNSHQLKICGIELTLTSDQKQTSQHIQPLFCETLAYNWNPVIYSSLSLGHSLFLLLVNTQNVLSPMAKVCLTLTLHLSHPFEQSHSFCVFMVLESSVVENKHTIHNIHNSNKK